MQKKKQTKTNKTTTNNQTTTTNTRAYGLAQGKLQTKFERNPWNRFRDNCYTDERQCLLSIKFLCHQCAPVLHSPARALWQYQTITSLVSFADRPFSLPLSLRHLHHLARQQNCYE